MRVIVRCYWLEVGLIFAAGYTIGKKVASRKQCETNAEPKKKVWRYEDGKIIGEIIIPVR